MLTQLRALARRARSKIKKIPTGSLRMSTASCRYDALVLDVQGTELLVLQGAEPILNSFRYIKLEVFDFEAYAGCCQVKDVSGYLKGRGYKEFSRNLLVKRDAGRCYDMVYKFQ